MQTLNGETIKSYGTNKYGWNYVVTLDQHNSPVTYFEPLWHSWGLAMC